MLTRRKFVGASLLSLAALPIIGSSRAFATEPGLITLEENLAVDIAERFCAASYPSYNLRGSNPVRYYSKDGEALGYIIDLFQEGAPFGYVIVDKNASGLISEFSIGEGIEGPYSKIFAKNSKTRSIVESDVSVYKLNALDYGVFSNATGEGATLSVDSSTAEKEGIEEFVSGYSNRPDNWNNILIDPMFAAMNYTFGNSEGVNLPLAFSQQQILDNTPAHHYACSVTAMLNCLYYYCSQMDPWNDYEKLWSYSETSFLRQQGSYTFGTTAAAKVGPAFSRLCGEKGVKVNNSIAWAFVNFETFASAVRYNPCILGATLSGNSDSAHAMAVFGYTIMTLNSNPSALVKCLKVYDGWYNSYRFLNFDNSYFTGLSATLFSR